MTEKITIDVRANVRRAYRRGGLDLSKGQTVTVELDKLSDKQLAALESDPRVTIKGLAKAMSAQVKSDKPAPKPPKKPTKTSIEKIREAAVKAAGDFFDKEKSKLEADEVAANTLEDAKLKTAALEDIALELSAAEKLRDASAAAANQVASDAQKELTKNTK